MDFVTLLSRWTHVGTAIVLVGGAVFMRFVVMPAAAQLSDEAHSQLRSAITARWKRFVHGGILLFLLSGFYNYLVVGVPQHEGTKLYHPLIGTKILLALAIFFIASALAGKSEKFEPIRANAKMWLTVLIVLAAMVVGISGYVKIALPPTEAASETAAE